MTKDLALLIHGDAYVIFLPLPFLSRLPLRERSMTREHYLNTEEFMQKIADNFAVALSR